jgi:hypothetical protein
MNNGFACILFFLMVPCTIQAQEPILKMNKANVTIHTGPMVSWLRGNTSVDNTNQNKKKIKLGYTIGLLYDKPLNQKLGFSTGLLFERKGGISLTDATYYDEVDQVTKQGVIEFEYRYDYFTLPIFLTYEIDRGNLSFGGGGFVGYLNKQVLFRNPLFPSSGISFFDETELNTLFDLGVAANVKYKIHLNEHTYLTLQVLNTYGLLNIRRELMDNQSMKTNSLSFLIGINIK